MIVGIDEAGRGSWAGPLVAAAVILPAITLVGTNDSKQLSKRQRETAFRLIQTQAVAIGIGWVPAEIIDQEGLNQANAAAMTRALGQITIPYSQVIIDGNVNFLPDILNCQTIIKADQIVPCVSAASIVAKVLRDRYMQQISERYPNYEFARHVGYGTTRHRACLEKFGVCLLHRRSFKPVKLIADAG